ncbi:MAG: hypothetical protein VX028_03720 [Nanoarchaeota archaeon]|nr:hypothetical protein [Nanoarchaeota archaeon]
MSTRRNVGGKYMEVREKNTSKGNKGTIMKKWSSKSKKETNSKKEVPLGITLLSLFMYFIALVYFLGGILLAFNTAMFESLFEGLETITYSLGILSIAVILLSALIGWIGYSLYKGKNWSRITVVVLVSISFISNVIALFLGFFGVIFALLLQGLVIWYLLFSDDVVNYFNK